MIPFNVHQPVQNCTNIHRTISNCIKLHQHATNYTKLHQLEQTCICIKLHQTPDCNNLY